MAIFTHSSLLVIGFVTGEGMERGERVDVNTHMITHDLFLEAFTQPLYSWNVLALKIHTFHYCLHSNNEIKQCTASVNLPFQNLVKVCASCLHGCF